MIPSRPLLVITVAASMLLGLAGCNECGRRLYVFTDVEDDSGAPVEGAAVELSCRDADSGEPLTSEAVSDASGEAVLVVHAPNRECPDDAFAHSSYFESCTIEASAVGFEDRLIELDGQALDDLPRTDRAGEAGHGVTLRITLEPPR